MKQEVKQQCSVVPQASALQLPSKDELAEMRRKLEDNLVKLTPRLQAQLNCLPADAAASGMVLSELTEQAAMDDLREDKKGSRSAVFAKRWEQVAVIKRNLDPGMAVVNDAPPRLVEQIESAIADLRKWQDQFTDHEQLLQRLASDLEAGHLNAAVSDEKLGERKFAGLNYQPVTDLLALESALKEIEGAKRGKAARLVKELRAKYPKAGAQTELIQQINKHQTRSVSEKRMALLAALLVLGLMSAGGKVAFDGYREQQHKAEAERLAFERITTEAQARLSKEVQSRAVGGKLEIPLSSSVSAQFCFIPSGSFTMGSPSSEYGRSDDEEHVEVTLSQPFWLAKTEVTQAQWEAVIGDNPSHFNGAQLPVENVSWEDAQSFITKLNESKVLPEGWKFALPTDAQWEYACRAGQKGPYSGGSLEVIGWYDGNSAHKTHEVGQKKPNALGLQDMHGNVYEWCADWYADTLKGGVDPKGPESGTYPVVRGGSWDGNANYCRAAARSNGTPGITYYYSPGVRNDDLGFRPALVSSK
jgi:formylglycine-generating enzyme required for sulfatase activity